MRTEIVGTRWRGWKVLLVLVILGLVLGLVIWFLAKAVKMLAPKGFRNKELYIPRIRRY